MDHKIIKIVFIFFFIFYNNISSSSIFYDKGDILITENEIQLFQILYKRYKGIDINKNTAIKKIILQKKIINKFIDTQIEYIKSLDDLIIAQNGKRILKDKIELDFIRYLKIQEEFILDYYNSEFNIGDLKLIIGKFHEIKLPISNNDCLTFLNHQDFKNDKQFINNLFNDLKNKIRDYSFKIDDENYEVCINNKFYQIIENEIIRYIELNTEKTMREFAYE
jgi:hypothetical protein